MADQNPIDDELLGKFLAGKADPVESAWVQQWLGSEAVDKAAISPEEGIRLNQLWPVAGTKMPFVHYRFSMRAVPRRLRLVNRRLATWTEQKGKTISVQPVSRQAGGYQPLILLTTCLVVVASIGWLVYRLRGMGEDHPEARRVTLTANGQRISKTLPDGTRVLLNYHSTLHYPFAFSTNSRAVNLRGEAFFTVTTGFARSFQVNTRHGFVEATGASFSVRTTETELSVAVRAGAVRLVSGQKTIVLTQHQQTTVEARSTKIQRR